MIELPGKIGIVTILPFLSAPLDIAAASEEKTDATRTDVFTV